MECNIDQLIPSDKIRKMLKADPFNMNDFEIRTQIGFTAPVEATYVRVHRRLARQTEDILQISINGQVRILPKLNRKD